MNRRSFFGMATAVVAMLLPLKNVFGKAKRRVPKWEIERTDRGAEFVKYGADYMLRRSPGIDYYCTAKWKEDDEPSYPIEIPSIPVAPGYQRVAVSMNVCPVELVLPEGSLIGTATCSIRDLKTVLPEAGDQLTVMGVEGELNQ